MRKHSSFQEERPKSIKRSVHPIWRVIGFIMAFLIPFLSYFLSLIAIEQNRANHWIRIPPEFIARGLGDPYLYVKILLTILISVILFGIFSLITFFLYGLLAPPRYGPYDAPPVRYRGKPYKR
ncbi:MAG: hypothetical protein HPY76_03330 [Anaerolineae bacterium]|jgi:hypothetical protein|nr:hypothetical protein [Anaerolineae bacterium]